MKDRVFPVAFSSLPPSPFSSLASLLGQGLLQCGNFLDYHNPACCTQRERERAQVNQACKIYRGVGGKLELVAVNGVTVKKK